MPLHNGWIACVFLGAIAYSKLNYLQAALQISASTGVDIVSLDWTVDIGTIRQQFPASVGLQGNLDPVLLFAPQAVLKERALAIIEAGRRGSYIFNLGHGVLQGTPEENVAYLFDLVKSLG